jgi:hypothetical protein
MSGGRGAWLIAAYQIVDGLMMILENERPWEWVDSREKKRKG